MVVADARDPTSYPPRPFIVTTSPVYANKRCADYRNGPTPTTKTKGRRDYGIALGRALHPDNLARATGRPALMDAYWAGHAEAVKHWDDDVILNVDGPIAEAWCLLLAEHDYRVRDIVPVRTRRYRGLDNAEKRAEFEVVIVGYRTLRCTDCRVDVFGEWYMVHDSVWRAAGMTTTRDSGHGFLCIGCLEDRLGRALTKEDFTSAPVNDVAWGHKSSRLADRLRRSRYEQLTFAANPAERPRREEPTMSETTPASWDERCPDGAVRYYEGDDPDGFAAKMMAEFGFDVRAPYQDAWVRLDWNHAEGGRAFFIPPGLVGAVYGSERWPIGS